MYCIFNIGSCAATSVAFEATVYSFFARRFYSLIHLECFSAFCACSNSSGGLVPVFVCAFVGAKLILVSTNVSFRVCLTAIIALVVGTGCYSLFARTFQAAKYFRVGWKFNKLFFALKAIYLNFCPVVVFGNMIPIAFMATKTSFVGLLRIKACAAVLANNLFSIAFCLLLAPWGAILASPSLSNRWGNVKTDSASSTFTPNLLSWLSSHKKTSCLVNWVLAEGTQSQTRGNENYNRFSPVDKQLCTLSTSNYSIVYG